MTSNKLFVYGIFLSEDTRKTYGMTNPRYATVLDYVTTGCGDSIVGAKKLGHKYDQPRYERYELSGLIVNVPPKRITPQGVVSNWERLDRLEGAYDRKMVRTTDGEQCWMYVAK